MAGTFTPTARPTQPGSFTDFIDETNGSAPVSRSQTVAIAGTHTWGPYNEAVDCVSYEDFTQKFGSADTDLRRGVLQAFIGEGVAGKAGAGAVVVVRQARAGIVASATGALKSTGTFTATTATGSETLTVVSSMKGLAIGQTVTGAGIPAGTTISALIPGKSEVTLSAKATANGVAVVLTVSGAALNVEAKYPGTAGNNVALTVQAGAIEHTQQLLVLNEGAVVERFTFPTNTTGFLAALAAQVNGVSKFVKFTVVNDNLSLSLVTSVALTGGNDGSAITSADYTTTFAALSTASFSVVSFANLTDTEITASVAAWAIAQNSAGTRFELVLGGKLGETSAEAEAAASLINNENVVRIGVGTITDDDNILPGTPVNMSTAQFAPRVAGVIAARGERRDLIMARFSGITLNSDAPQSAEINSAPVAGLTVFSSDGRQDAPVRIAEGCTTFTTPTSGADPRNPAQFKNNTNVYGSVKYVRIMQGIENDIQAWQEQGDEVLGDLNVTTHTASTLVGYARSVVIGERIKAGVIQAPSTAFLDTTTFGPFSEDNEFIAIGYGVKFSPTLRQVFNSVAVNI